MSGSLISDISEDGLDLLMGGRAVMKAYGIRGSHAFPDVGLSIKYDLG